ncbi:MAG: ABC transporter substrate-binding protein [Desulfobacterales bacterium]|nr:ABC transporter substrate-binding protein [Desulfobacterales bacterium]MBU0734966.1 ABC transporter substrate-binding protein [Pseudomonadota bacterium]
MMKKYDTSLGFMVGVLVLVFGMITLTISPALASDPVKVSILTDMSGPYAGITASNVEAAKMAIADFGGKLLGKDIDFVYRDHQCKADLGNQKAKELYEKEKVDVIFDCPNSAAGLAVSNQALLHKKLFFSIGSGTTRHTGPDCNRYTFDWAYNDYMLATAVGLWAADNLGKKWYTITADYAWGHDLLKHFKHALESKGGTLLGNDMVALGTSDFSPYILNAMKANPEVLVLLNAGKDGVNSTKQANEFGLKKKAKIVHALLFIEGIKAVGSDVFADDYVTGAWYWKSKNPGAKEFVEKWRAKFNKPPNWMNAATYSCVTQYLEAVKRAGTKDPKAVIKQLEGHKFRDLLANPGYIRPEDHMQVGDAYILRVKRPEEVKEAWDYFEIVGVVPAKQAHMDPNETGCKMGGF